MSKRIKLKSKTIKPPPTLDNATMHLAKYPGHDSYHERAVRAMVAKEPAKAMREMLLGKYTPKEIASAVAAVCKQKKNLTEYQILEGVWALLEPKKHPRA